MNTINFKTLEINTIAKRGMVLKYHSALRGAVEANIEYADALYKDIISFLRTRKYRLSNFEKSLMIKTLRVYIAFDPFYNIDEAMRLLRKAVR